MSAFIEERLDLRKDFGEVGGPTHATDVVILNSGHEHRSPRWDVARGRWELGEAFIDETTRDELLAFFRSVRGRSVGFRFRDWQDYQAVNEVLVTDGSPTVDLIKTYALATEQQVRRINKPVGGTVTMQRDGAAYTFASIDTTTGVVTLAKDVDLDITDVTAASPAVVTTSSAHGLSDGEEIWITGTGLAEIDDQVWIVTTVDADSFSLDGSDTSATGGSTDGFVEQYVQSTETLTWSGDFDVPVRFDTDEFRARFVRGDGTEFVYELSSLPVVELRL